MAYAQEKQVGIDAVLRAAQLCQRVRNTIQPEAIAKNDKSPVTIADFGSQAVICKAIRDTFPNDPIVGEEDALDLRTPDFAPIRDQVLAQVQTVLPDATAEAILDWIDFGNGKVSDRYWTLDPIDGTKGFLRGDQYAIALALVEGGEIKLGILACPALSLADQDPGLLFVAVRGEGTTMIDLNDSRSQPIRVAEATQMESLRFVESVEAGHGNQQRQLAVAQAVGINQPSMRMDSQAKYGAVAAGQAVLYLRLPSPKTPDYREKIWDHAAGAIVVEEAGGRVTDMQGKPLDFSRSARFEDNHGVVVSNGLIHDTVLTALAQAS